MQNVPLNDLKKNLGVIGKRVAHGERIVVTKHNKPYFQIVQIENEPAANSDDPRVIFKNDPTVHVGDLVGKASLEGFVKGSPELARKALEYLFEDREDDR